MLSAVSQMEKANTGGSHSMWNQKEKGKTKNQAHRNREETGGRRGDWGWAKWVGGVERYKRRVIR